MVKMLPSYNLVSFLLVKKKGKDVGLYSAETTADQCYHIFLDYKGELHSNY